LYSSPVFIVLIIIISLGGRNCLLWVHRSVYILVGITRFHLFLDLHVSEILNVLLISIFLCMVPFINIVDVVKSRRMTWI
jgi:hypothetical protein